MSSIVESVLSGLQGPALQRLAGQVGADETAVRNGAAAAVPLLLGALANNASTDQGAQALLGALRRDHDGGILNDLQGFLSGGNAVQNGGAAILKHVLGQRAGPTGTAVAKAGGLTPAQSSMLLAALAPIVMGALGRAQRAGGLDASSLGKTLGTERQNIAAGNPAIGALLGTLLNQTGGGSASGGNSAAANLGTLLSGVLKKK